MYENTLMSFSPSPAFFFQRPPTIALRASSLVFILPAMLNYHCKQEAILWIFVTICSYVSDITYAGKISYWHCADRFLSKCTFLYLLFIKPYIFSSKETYITQTLTVFILLIPGLHHLSQEYKESDDWIYNHLWWHIYGGLAVTVSALYYNLKDYCII